MADTNSPNPVVNSTEAPAATGSASGAPTGTAGGENWTAATVIHSLDELRTKAPKIYNAMMQGAAMTIIIQSKHDQDKLKEKWDEMLREFQ